DDSSVCTAAVHAGLITFAAGGSVTIEIQPDAVTYTGSERNGVSSGSWSTWYGSFVFVTP
ncbi:MAG: LCCL domain-containing protein, partial [Chloroflexota bacterium]